MADELRCRVTVSVGGHHTGSIVRINPDDEWMKVYLKAGWIVPMDPEPKEENETLSDVEPDAAGEPSVDAEPVEDLHDTEGQSAATSGTG